MWVKIFNLFTKITAWPLQWFCFRTRVRSFRPEGRRIKGAAILVSNHTSVFDYAVYLFVFFTRTLRFQMAEVLFERPFLGLFLRQLGGIRVDRDSTNLSFLAKSAEILKKGGVVGIFPEGRLPLPGEERPLPFKSGAAFLALQTGVPVIPLYTNGAYFCKKRCHVLIGEPILPQEIEALPLSDKEKIEHLSRLMRQKIMELGEKDDEA